MTIPENFESIQPVRDGLWSVNEKGRLTYNDTEYQITHLRSPSSESHTTSDTLQTLAAQLNQLHIDGRQETIQLKISQNTIEISKATSLTQKTLPISPKPYEELVDEFLNKLVALGYEGNISKLKRDIIERNQLTLYGIPITSLPLEIGNLRELRELELANTRLTSLPPEFGNLRELRTLNLNGTQLTSLPPEIGNLRELRTLSLYGTQLTSLPPEIGNLRELQDLILKNTQLTGLPPEIGNLRNLILLGLNDTQITSLPPEIGNLRELQDLNLNGTQLTNLPPEIGNLSKLEYLDLVGTQITSLPPEIGNLRELQTLNLQRTQLTSLPSTVRNLRNLTVLRLDRGTPISAQGGETTLGRQELRAHFGDRVLFDTPQTVAAMPASTTKEQVYQHLDDQPLGINREQLKNTKMPEIPAKAFEDGSDFLLEFHKVISKMNFDNEIEADYLSHELLAGDFARDARNGSNWEKISQNVLGRLTGYFKTLYGMPLKPGETGGWQMYEDKKPALKKALSFVITQMAALEDKEQLASLFTQLVTGILHCPTGQKEALDTICLALLENKIARSSDLPKIVGDIIAIKKNAFFKTAILTKGFENTQNVHLISSYEGKLKDELGLTNVLEYDERMGTMGRDPFRNNSANVLKIYYDLVTPARLADWIVEKTLSRKDAELRLQLLELQKRQSESSPTSAPLVEKKQKLTEQLQNPATKAEEKLTLQAQIENLEQLIRAQKSKTPALNPEDRAKLKGEIALLKSQKRANAQFKPISNHIILDYLRTSKAIDTEQPNWWKEHFSQDPTIYETATLTHSGALKLLGRLGYLFGI